VDVTKILKEKTQKSFNLTESFDALFGDPAPGMVKTLSVEYLDQNGIHTKNIQ